MKSRVDRGRVINVHQVMVAWDGKSGSGFLMIFTYHNVLSVIYYAYDECQ